MVELDLLSRIHDDLILIQSTQVLAPMAAAALERALSEVKALDLLITARFVTQEANNATGDR